MTSDPSIILLIVVIVVFSLIGLFNRKKGGKSYSAAEAAERHRAGGAVLLDVRTDAERAASHIPGSVHIPLHELKNRLGELEKYKGREIICYCRSGNRSRTAVSMLGGQGFDVANMSGGIMRWDFSR